MSDIEEFIAFLNKRTDGFYHFTDTRNLATIRSHGLLALNRQGTGARATAPGGNDWSHDADRRTGMDGYVHLCFRDNHPMEWQARQDGRIAQSVFLRIAPEVLRIPGTLICDMVSNHADARPAAAATMLGQLDLAVLYERTDWRDAKIQARLQIATKYEILVPGHVPLELITKIPNG